MKCELCHKAEAQTAVYREVEGVSRELYVCQQCALRKASVPKADGTATSGEMGAPTGVVVPPSPMMGMILDAAFEIVGRAIASEEPQCSVCGITRSEQRKRRRLGCPACYDSFARELDAAILEMHRNTRHVGKIPKKEHATLRRRELQEQLERAVAGQRFEEAIQIRDQLRREGPEREGPGGGTE